MNSLTIKKSIMKTRNESSAIRLLTVILLQSILVVFAVSCGKIKETNTDPDKDAKTGELIYVHVDKLPVFNGGDTALLRYLARNTVYPKDAALNNIQGKVLVKLVVGKDSQVSNVEVIEGVNPLLDAEAVRVVSTLPKFEKPGYVNGKPVAVYYMVPIQFKLK
jgi:TonB family protein